MRGAFFDLDRTLIARSSSLALATTFRERGLIGRRELVGAAVTQLVFSRFGAGTGNVHRMAERGMASLAGLRVTDVCELVDDALETRLLPLVYRGALEKVEEHRGRGEPSYLVSAALQQIVDALVARLGLAGGVGSLCEAVDGVFTGRVRRALHGEAKADAVRELAAHEGITLPGSTAYSDSHSDLPFLETVGSPVAVNPDTRLRRIARERGWPIVCFEERSA